MRHDGPDGHEGRPPPGDSSEGPWFRSQVEGTRRKGAHFGSRKDEYLPYLVVRAAPGDRGARPLVEPFWESIDIFVTAGVDADMAPLHPGTAAGLAEAGLPNTVYAHVWNLGRAPARRARVEFYWCDPTLGISVADAHMIGAAWVDLGGRFAGEPKWREVTTPYGSWLSAGSHAVVKCPTTWTPVFENGGHECLVVRVFEPIFDAIPPDQFASWDCRQVAQRNITVVNSASPASIDITFDLGWHPEPADATISVELIHPGDLPWLALYLDEENPQLQTPGERVTAGLLPPSPRGARLVPVAALDERGRQSVLRTIERFRLGCDPMSVMAHVSIGDMKPGEAQPVRITQTVDGNVVGGYTIVLMGT